MFKFILVVLISLFTTVCFADSGVMITEPLGNNKVPVFAPDQFYDAILTVNKTAIPVSGFVAVGITGTTSCKVYKSATNSTTGKVALTYPGDGSTFIRGINKGVKFVIYSGCTGAVLEKQ